MTDAVAFRSFASPQEVPWYSADHLMQQMGWDWWDAIHDFVYASDEELAKFIKMCKVEPPAGADPERVARMDNLDWIGLFNARKEQERRREGGKQKFGGCQAMCEGWAKDDPRYQGESQ